MRKHYDFSKAKRGAVVAVPKGKSRITIRLDDAIIECFKAQVEEAGGGNYHSSCGSGSGLARYIWNACWATCGFDESIAQHAYKACALATGSSDRGSRLRYATEGVDDRDKAAPLGVDAFSRRNLIIRRMSTATHRAVELLVGFALLGYGAYAIYAGHVLGKFRSYTRSDNPWSFWTAVLITLGVGTAFLFGAVSWRN